MNLSLFVSSVCFPWPAVTLRANDDDITLHDNVVTNQALFQCPDECQECCVHDVKRFKCVLRAKWRVGLQGPLGKDCEEVRQRKSVRNQAKVLCKFEKDQHALQKDSVSELSAKCSKMSRCCCDINGVGFCAGDQYHIERLKRLYAIGEHFNGTAKSMSRLFPLTNGGPLVLNSWGMCPIGFSDWKDGANIPCDCDTACGEGNPAWPPEPRAPPTAHRWKQMVSLAAGIYAGEPQVSGWKLQKFWDVAEDSGVATDYVGIYRREIAGKKHCALTFAGTDDVLNTGADMFGWLLYAKKWCGWDGVHTSFADYMRAFMNKHRYSEFDAFLADSNECDIVVSLGHSLGGSLAELLAGCANRPDTERHISKKVDRIHFKVHEVYTFGACGVSTSFITNRMEPDGCFPGARFVLTKQKDRGLARRSVDPVTNLGSLRVPKALLHPKTSVVALKKIKKTIRGNKSAIKFMAKVVTLCNSSYPNSRPKLWPLKNPSKKLFYAMQTPWKLRHGVHNWKMHLTKVYFDFLAHISDFPDSI